MANVTPDPMLTAGTLIQDTYEILEPLGQGGMGATYKARHRAMGHLVAAKVINPDLTEDPRALELFKREANLMREISQSSASDAIVKIETLLQDRNGTLYLIMEFIDGKPLSHYIKQGARLSETDLLKFSDRMLSALATIHAHNIVHRDISPDNIMVPNDNILEAKILDFGVASNAVGTEKSILGDTFAGKIGYASPEQFGLYDGKVTGLSDIYSLGLVLLAAFGVKPTAAGNIAATIENRKTDIDLSNTKLSSRSQKLIGNLLRSDPQKRVVKFDTAAASTPSPNGYARSQSVQKSRRLPILALTVLGPLTIGVSGYFLVNGGNEKDIPPETNIAVQDGVDMPSVDVNTGETIKIAPKTDGESVSKKPPPVPPLKEPPNITDIWEKAKEKLFQDPAVPKPTPDVESKDNGNPPVGDDPVPQPVVPKITEMDPTPSPPPETKPKKPTAADIMAFDSINILIDYGGKANRLRAIRALKSLEAEDGNALETRGRAAYVLGRLYDPKYLSAETLVYAKAEPDEALLYYRRAIEFGVIGLTADITRLERTP